MTVTLGNLIALIPVFTILWRLEVAIGGIHEMRKEHDVMWIEFASERNLPVERQRLDKYSYRSNRTKG
jgi:desulfoferrodoxin (superoxide reductase-like protein)